MSAHIKYKHIDTLIPQYLATNIADMNIVICRLLLFAHEDHETKIETCCSNEPTNCPFDSSSTTSAITYNEIVKEGDPKEMFF